MNLLIVDDEIYALQGILAGLDKDYAGIDTVYTANCYSQAINVFMEHTVDLLLCDIEMPFGSGLDLVEWVKTQYKDTECIILTCHAEFSFAQQAIKLNCIDYVVKPVEPETLNAILRGAVEQIQDKKKESIYTEYGKVYLKNISDKEEDTENPMEETVDQAERYILEHIEDTLMVEEIARNFYISVNHLNRLFKKKHNTTVGDYITDVRMKTAAGLLETTNLSIAAVSAKSGYNNYSYFIKIFKRYYGVTPKEYMLDRRRKR